MKSCFLEGCGRCEGGLSREHYISKTILEKMAGGKNILVGGFPWQDEKTLRSVGINSLVTNSLCRRHNAALANLDAEAGRLFSVFDGADKNPASVPSLTQITGKLIERWLIKVLCGMVGSAGFNNGVVPEVWKKLLLGGSWPSKWGMYFDPSPNKVTFSKEFELQNLIDVNGDIKGSYIRVAGVPLTLMLCRPDFPSNFGIHRPRGMAFEAPDGIVKKVEFKWKRINDHAIYFRRTGTSPADRNRHEGWEIEPLKQQKVRQ